MKKSIFTGLVCIIIILSIDAQDNTTIYSGLHNQSEIKKHRNDMDAGRTEEQSHSMSMIAKETPSGPGKGEIVSNQAKQLGEAKRYENQTKKPAVSHNELRHRENHGNRSGMHASLCQRKPNKMPGHFFIAAMHNGRAGRR